MVSRYVVDVALVGGFFIGVLGPAYLARGMYTISGNRLLRQTLVGAPAVVVMAVFISGIFGPHASTLRYSVPLDLAQAPGIGLAIAFVMTAVCGTERGIERTLDPQEVKRLVSFWALTEGADVVLLLLATVLFMGSSAWGGVYVGLALLALLVLLRSVQRFLSMLSSRLLVVLGLLFILLGIATQLLPPVLDLLGINVV